MRVLLENLETRRFYAADGSWVTDRAMGHDFQTTSSAMGFCFEQNIRPAQLLVLFPESGNEINMPIPTRPPSPEWPALFSVAGAFASSGAISALSCFL